MSFFQRGKKRETGLAGRLRPHWQQLRRDCGPEVKSLLRKKSLARPVVPVQYCACCLFLLTAMQRIYLLGILLLLAACKKDAPDAGLPPATQQGKNTGGCLINGERFIATETPGNILTNPIPALGGGFAFDSVYYVTLSGSYQGKRATVMLFLRTRVAGTYQLNQNTQYYPQGSPRMVLNNATFAISGSGGETYVTNSQHTGQVVLTRMDKQADISAGTFEFTAASAFDPSKTVTVTNGRFDRKQ